MKKTLISIALVLGIFAAGASAQSSTHTINTPNGRTVIRTSCVLGNCTSTITGNTPQIVGRPVPPILSESQIEARRKYLTEKVDTLKADYDSIYSIRIAMMDRGETDTPMYKLMKEAEAAAFKNYLDARLELSGFLRAIR